MKQVVLLPNTSESETRENWKSRLIQKKNQHYLLVIFSTLLQRSPIIIFNHALRVNFKLILIISL